MERVTFNVKLLDERINKFYAAQKLTNVINKADNRAQLSYLTGVDQATFSKISKHNIKDLRVITLYKIVNVIGGKMEDFIIDIDMGYKK